jgi:hypothetical protein
MNKKITSSALAALMIAGTTSFSAFAAMPSGTVVIGTKAFDLAYANDTKNADEITNLLVTGGTVYFKDFEGNWIDNVTNAKVLASVIPAVTYKNAAGVETKFAATDKDDAAIEITSVSALTNSKVKVALKTAVSVAPLASNFTIKNADGTVLTVKETVLSADGKAVILTTDAQKAYTAYTLTYGVISKSFVGIPADTTKLALDNVAVASYVSVKVTFKEKVDEATAMNVANYTMDNNLTVLKATLAADGLTVTLTTAAQTVGTIYNLTVQNVADLAGNVMDKSTNNYFGGMSKDTSKLTVATVAVEDYNKVKVVFGKEVNETTATNIANYKMDNNLAVLKAEIDEDDEDGKTVILTTGDQIVGTIYKLSINNITDNLDNGMEKAYDAYFGGMAKDLGKPVAGVAVTDSDKVTVTFTKKVAKADAENIANYTVDNSLTIVKAELDTDAKTVELTTSPQVVGTIYKMTVQNIKSELGTAMDKTEAYFGGMAKDLTGPSYTVVSSEKSLVITFNEKVNKESAEEAINYALDGELGFPTKAVLAKDEVTVTLTTAPQKTGKIYNVTVNNVKDLNGNVISSTNAANKKSFVGTATAVASVVKYQAATIVNNNTIDLIFDTELSAAKIANMNVVVTSATTSALQFKATVQENKKVVRVQFRSDSVNPELFKAGVIYTANVSGVTGLEAVVAGGNTNTKSFAGNGIANTAPEIKAVVPVDATTLRVVFTKPVTGILKAAFTVTGNTVKGVSVEATDVVTETLVYLDTATVAGQIYKLQLQAGLTDAAGFMNVITVDSKNVQLEYQFAGTNVVNTTPAIKAVVATDKYNFDIIFTEAVKAENATTSGALNFSLDGIAITDITTSGTIALDLTGATKTLSEDGTKLTISLKAATLGAGKLYKAVIGKVTDLSGLVMDQAANSTANNAKFAGTNVENVAPQIAGITVSADRKTIKVTFSEDVDGTFDASTLVLSAKGYSALTTYTATEVDGVVTITLGTAIDADQIATIKATDKIVDINGQGSKTDAVQFGVAK